MCRLAPNHWFHVGLDRQFHEDHQIADNGDVVDLYGGLVSFIDYPDNDRSDLVPVNPITTASEEDQDSARDILNNELDEHDAVQTDEDNAVQIDEDCDVETDEDGAFQTDEDAVETDQDYAAETDEGDAFQTDTDDTGNTAATGTKRKSTRQVKNRLEQKDEAPIIYVAMEDDWVFDCSVCGLRGKNVDDGEHSISCDRCNVWEHTECHGITEQEAEADDYPFLCNACRSEEAKSKVRKEQSRKFHPLKAKKISIYKDTDSDSDEDEYVDE